jgi:hypothetical protein
MLLFILKIKIERPVSLNKNQSQALKNRNQPNMGSTLSHMQRMPEFTNLQNPHDEVVTHERERSRRDTMKDVLKCLSQETPNGIDYIMTAYTQWLLTAKKTNQKGRPMNRWDLMTAFVETQLIL